MDAIDDLQVQIDALVTKDTDLQNQIDLINSGMSHVVIVEGIAWDDATISPPTGYTIDQCDLIPHPKKSICMRTMV